MWTPCIFWYTLYNEVSLLSRLNNISYPLFADADGGIYLHAASQYHMRLKAKHGIAMLSVDEFQYLQEQTRDNEFIPCSKGFYYYQKYQKSFLLGLNHCVNTVVLGHIAADRKDDDGLITIETQSIMLFSLTISCWWHQTWDTCIYFMVVSQSEARVSTAPGMSKITSSVIL